MKGGRILQLIGSFEVGGSEIQAVKLTNRLVREGTFEVRAACLDTSGPLIDRLGEVGNIQKYPLNSFYDRNFLRQVGRLSDFIRTERIDLVQTHDFYTNIFGMAGARLARVTGVASKRETYSKTRKQLFVEKQAFRLAKKIIVNSEAIREFLIAAGVTESKIVTVYNGLDPECFVERPNGDRSEALAGVALNVRPDAKLVTIVANMRSDVKNHELFLRSAKRVGANNEKAIFLIVGEGELQGRYEQMAHELGIADKCRFLGPRSDVGKLLSVSDVGVLCSRSEGFSNAILEYMAAGLPVVATDVGGAREAVQDGKTGFVIPPNDEPALTSAISLLLDDNDLAVKMGSAGQVVAKERFSETAQLEAVMSLYAKLLDNSHQLNS
ncbi:MAG TPA: hypothetical protein DEP46_08995 [Blastocatellia bacterium]|nr:hypothetical protein [Blastocatellia bacterium]